MSKARAHQPKPDTAKMIRAVKEYLKDKDDAAALPYDTIIEATGATRYAITTAKGELGLLQSQIRAKKQADKNGGLSDEQMKEVRKAALYQRRNHTNAGSAANAVAKQYDITDENVIRKLTAYVQTYYSPRDKISLSTMALRVPFSEFGTLVAIGEESLLMGAAS